MIVLKNERDIEAMRVSGSLAAGVLDAVCKWIRPGLTTKEIDDYAAGLIREHGAKSAFLGYRNLLPAKQIESIAVMPFLNESKNPEVEYLSDGMTETLISSLSELRI